jgi:lysophospholipase L1-like esterase
MLKTIVCYGDSNTWGSIPGKYYQRFPPDVRWPGILRSRLGERYAVIEEGLPGRTTLKDDPLEEGRNGKTLLLPILRTHRPMDMVIIFLGTNDLKARFSLTAYDIARGAIALASTTMKCGLAPANNNPAVLLLAPAPLGKLDLYAEEFEGGTEKSLKLGDYYRQRAVEAGCLFLDAGKIVSSSDLDGVHLEAEAHQKIGQAVAELVMKH